MCVCVYLNVCASIFGSAVQSLYKKSKGMFILDFCLSV